MKDAATLLERWPGYDEQSWPERFAELDRQYLGAMTKASEMTMRITQQATDRAYMIEALVQMLGPKGRQVWQMWQSQGVQRIHSCWEDDPYAVPGEEIAERHLKIEEAIRSVQSAHPISGEG